MKSIMTKHTPMPSPQKTTTSIRSQYFVALRLVQTSCVHNYCWLYLQAITVNNISNATGNTLMPGIQSGDYTLWSGVTHYHKTNQAKPDNSTWRLWSRVMLLIADSHENLCIPLCQWIPPPHCQWFTCPFYYDPMMDGLYFTRTDRFNYHRRISRRFFPILLPISVVLSRCPRTQLPFTIIRMAGSLTATIHIVQHPPRQIQRRSKLSARFLKIGSPSSFLMSTFLSTPLFSFPNRTELEIS
jgi:hypothetical protein